MKGEVLHKFIYFVLMKKNSKAEEFLTTVLMRLVDAAELDQYFPNGKANEYTQDHNFVNISFINPGSLKNSPVWDPVPKDNSKHTINKKPSGTLYTWGFNQLMMILQQQWEKLYKEGELNQDTIINTVSVD